MERKLTMLGIAAAAFVALAVPAAANASPVLKEGTTTLAAGAKLLGTSNDFVITDTALGTLTCKKATFETEVTQNNGSSVTAIGLPGSAANKAEACNASGKALTITRLTILSLHTTKEDKGTLSLTFIADVGPLECHFEGSGEFTYTTGGSAFVISGLALRANVELCEVQETRPTLEATFSIETAASPNTAITVD